MATKSGTTVQFSPQHRNKGGRPRGKTPLHDPARITQRAMPAKERMEKLAELARGITIKEVDKKGEAHIYTLPPNEKAIAQMNAYQFGKPKERTEVELTSGGKAMAIALLPPIVHPKKAKKGESEKEG